MESILYILGAIAFAAVVCVIIVAVRTLQFANVLMKDADSAMKDIKKYINQMTSEVSLIRLHAIPVLDNVADITHRISGITDGLAPRVEAIYDTVDDTLNVVRGALDDVERIKDSVVQTIESPLNAVRRTTTGVVGTIFKGVGVVRELISEFRKNGKS